ncbi:MAG: DNA-3-methyladenine glycosylase [Verrucomicrobiota bacterium]
MLIERIITSEACLSEGLAFLREREPKFAEALKEIGPIPLRLRDDGFPALLNAIVSQQLSVAAADSIWTKLSEAQFIEPGVIEKASDEALRGCGLSRPKIRYARALAESGVDFETLRQKPSDEVIAELVRIPGIGRWTAEIYLMFSLGRADVLAAGDLALQESARVLFDLPERPKEKDLAAMAEDWSPWRSVAARILWAHYRVVKNREGVTGE